MLVKVVVIYLSYVSYFVSIVLFIVFILQSQGKIELFVSSLHGSSPAPVAFTARHHSATQQPTRGRGKSGRFNNRGSHSS